MQSTFISLCLLAGALRINAEEVTPVQKVVQLMEGMLEKGKKEKDNEAVQFTASKQFCDDTSVERKRAIEESEETIGTLKADIQKYAADATKLTKEIAGLDQDVSIWQGDIKAATKVRAIEKTDYDAMLKDYSESVDALQRAIAVLKKQSFDRKQKSSLAQVTALKGLSLIPEGAKKTIDLFVQQDAEAKDVEGLAVTAPEANSYEFQSRGVIEMLEKLLSKFIDERTTLQKSEMNSKHAYDMLMRELKAQIVQAEADRGLKAENKAKRLQDKADASGDLNDATATKNADSKYLSDVSATCEQKASDFASRQQLRAEEIVAIEKAIEIISTNAVAGNAAKHLVNMVQKKPSALAQLRSTSATQSQERVAKYLHEQATKLNSRVLAAIATHAEDDPFKKVKKMIKDLMIRLMEQANEEAEHKGWCDTELSTNEQTRKEKTQAVETLHSEIDQLQASIAKLTEDVRELTQGVAELDAGMAKATPIRNAEKATNAETIKDAQDAQTAVAQALTVLKEFYAKAAEATAFAQQKAHAPYKGMGAEAGGVVGMLETIESDFSRLQSDTQASEATSQKEYDEFMTDSKVDKSEKATDIEHKNAKIQDESQALANKNRDLEGTQKELDASLSYYDKLKPSCVDSGASYEDRVARRKEEIASLQEALKILNGEDIA
jgi:prefoldin subunit 5